MHEAKQSNNITADHDNVKPSWPDGSLAPRNTFGICKSTVFSVIIFPGVSPKLLWEYKTSKETLKSLSANNHLTPSLSTYIKYFVIQICRWSQHFDISVYFWCRGHWKSRHRCWSLCYSCSRSPSDRLLCFCFRSVLTQSPWFVKNIKHFYKYWYLKWNALEIQHLALTAQGRNIAGSRPGNWNINLHLKLHTSANWY